MRISTSRYRVLFTRDPVCTVARICIASQNKRGACVHINTQQPRMTYRIITTIALRCRHGISKQTLFGVCRQRAAGAARSGSCWRLRSVLDYDRQWSIGTGWPNLPRSADLPGRLQQYQPRYVEVRGECVRSSKFDLFH